MLAFLAAFATVHEAAGEGTGVIAGRVVDEDGDPIEGIRAMIAEAPDYDPKKEGLTGIDGRYEVTVPAGEYRVHFKDSMGTPVVPGEHIATPNRDRPVKYEPVCFQQASCEAPDLVTVAAGQRVDHVDAQLQVTKPTISGRVFDAAGKPVSGILVQFSPPADADTQVHCIGLSTNRQGRYVAEIPGPGDYSFHFVDGSGPCGTETGINPGWNYSSESYKDKNEDWRGAKGETPDLVHADADSTVDGIDVVLEKCYKTGPNPGPWVNCPGTVKKTPSKPSGGTSSAKQGTTKKSPSPSGSITASPTPTPMASSSPSSLDLASAPGQSGSSVLWALVGAVGIGTASLAAFAVRRRRRSQA